MNNGLIVGLIITGVLILYVGVLIGIIYLAIKPYTFIEGYSNISTNNKTDPIYTKITIPPPCKKPAQTQLNYSSKCMTDVDNNNKNILIKDKKNRVNLSCEEFNNIYCKSSIEHNNNICCNDRNLYISSHFTDRLPLKHAVHNINLSNMKKTDILFINNIDVSREVTVFYNENTSTTFPRINLDKDNLHTHSELSGYYTYSTYIESDSSQMFTGISTDSIFISDPAARNEIYDKKTDNNGYFTSINVRMTSGTHAGKKLRLINIYKIYDKSYTNIDSFNVLHYIFDFIYKNFSNDLLIIGGYFGVRNELIQLAIVRSNLQDKLHLFPANNISTCNNFKGCSNPDAIIIDTKLIDECSNVKVITEDPWFYDNNNNYILTVILENFKSENYENSKETARSNWNIVHSTKNDIYPPKYEIPTNYVNNSIIEYNIRNNPVKIINVN
ncbi:unknown similar to AMEV141 [Adoxophyes honmai entomopoxvirus 'L']|uniref:Uncharacterized protein n=1 Tax=Adoxophyes honmai entomopoxvirus 'L' TaxID=1293540 RepID=A0A916KP77_9POXV|nr:unknown similar to AMEV141 [Adoxophyes honmai entomopoxvirus 'L']CCU55506.1 unknown similar to AMEV141 [Adoxophyes honmai entomopoxvirus 'L']